jgi:hypothetical protein
MQVSELIKILNKIEKTQEVIISIDDYAVKLDCVECVTDRGVVLSDCPLED